MEIFPVKNIQYSKFHKGIIGYCSNCGKLIKQDEMKEKVNFQQTCPHCHQVIFWNFKPKNKENNIPKNEWRQKAESLYRLLENIIKQNGVIVFSENRFYSIQKFEEALLKNIK